MSSHEQSLTEKKQKNNQPFSNQPFNHLEQKITSKPEALLATTSKLHGSRILLEWEAPAWVFEKADLSALKNFSIPIVIFFLISIFFKWFFLALSGGALIFLYLVLGKVEPQPVKHKISENGITTAGHTYIWSQLKDFFFTQKKNQTILNIDTNVGFPGRLFLVLQNVDKDQLQETLLGFLPIKEAGKEDLWDRVVDKVMGWLVIKK